VVVAWDGRLLQVFMHPDATGGTDVARRVNTAIREAGITGHAKAKEYVFDQVQPRRNQPTDGSGVRPAAGLAAAGGGDPRLLREALERVLGRDIGKQFPGRHADQQEGVNPVSARSARVADLSRRGG